MRAPRPKTIQRLLALFGFFCCHSVFAIDTTLSGYISAVAGKVLSGSYHGKYLSYDCPCFVADYPNVGVYENNGWNFDPDSTYGVQSRTTFTDSTRFTLQVVGNGGNNYKPELSWAYLSHDITDNLSMDIGRKRLPLFYYSDFYDVSYAYPWIRVPGDLYGWQVTNYNGASLAYTSQLGSGQLITSVWAGQEDTNDNREDYFYYWHRVDENWRDIRGLSLEYNYDWLTIRAVHMQNKVDIFEYNPDKLQTSAGDNQNFSGLAVNIDYSNFQIRTEYNTFKMPSINYKTEAFLVSIGYRIGAFTPTISKTRYEQGGNEQSTESAVLRWDVLPSTALKLQYDQFSDDNTYQFMGDSKTLAIGVDYTF